LVRAIFVLALPVLPAAPTAAQERPFQLSGFLQLQGEYTDNFFLTERNKRDEFREILTPGLSLRLSTGPSQARLSYAPSLVHSSLSEGELQVFHLFDGSGSLALTERLTLRASDRFLRTDEPAVTDPRGVRRDREVLTTNTLTSDLTFQQATWSLVPRYALTLIRSDKEDRERSTVHALGIDGTLEILGRNTLGAGYELTRGEFKIANDFTGHAGRVSFSRALDPRNTASLRSSIAHRDVEGGRDFDIVRGDVGLRRDVSPRYIYEARAGYASTSAVSGSREDAVEYSLTGTYTGKAVRLTLTSGQSLQETFLERDNVGVTRTSDHALEIRYEPIERLAVTFRGRFAENRFLQSRREDVRIEGGLELAFQLTRLLLLTLGYTYTDVDSNLAGFDFQNNRVRLGLTVTYE
jgi:hypothetical protein